MAARRQDRSRSRSGVHPHETWLISVGDRLEAEHLSAGSVSLWVRELRDDQATVDTNHPLAGQTVRFDVTIESARKSPRKDTGRAEKSHRSAVSRGLPRT